MPGGKTKNKKGAKTKGKGKTKSKAAASVTKAIVKAVARAENKFTPGEAKYMAAATSNVGRTTYFRQRKVGRNIEIQGQDYLCKLDIATTDAIGKILKSVPVTPQAFTSTKLATFAGMYEKFKFNKFSVHIVNASANTKDGGMLGFYEMDPDDALPSGAEALLRAGYAHKGHATNAYIPTSWHMPPQTVKTQDFFVDPGTDDRLNIQAIFNLAVENTFSAAVHATLFIEYDLTLFQEKWDSDTIQPGGVYAEGKSAEGKAGYLFNTVDMKSSDPAVDDGGNITVGKDVLLDGLVVVRPTSDWYLYAIEYSSSDLKTVVNAPQLFVPGTTTATTDWGSWQHSQSAVGGVQATFFGVIYRLGSRTPFTLIQPVEHTAGAVGGIYVIYLAAMPVLASQYVPPFAVTGGFGRRLLLDHLPYQKPASTISQSEQKAERADSKEGLTGPSVGRVDEPPDGFILVRRSEMTPKPVGGPLPAERKFG